MSGAAAAGRCHFCGGATAPALVATDRNRGISTLAFEYSRCADCGTYSLDNVPPDLGRYYPDDYYAFPRNRDEADRSLDGDRYKLELIRRHAPKGRLLEIGPGAGMFAHLMATSGYEVETIEMSPRSAKFLQDVLGIRTHLASDELAALAQCKDFDVIALWHVIEHVRAPAMLVEAAAKALRPGGILVLATPNPAALQFRLFGARWVHLDAPRHVWLIGPRALRECGARAGLREIEYTEADEGTRYWNRFGWDYTIRGLVERYIRRRPSNLVARIAGALAAPFEARAGAASAYTMILRKA